MAIYDSTTVNSSKRSTRQFKDIDLDFGRNTVTNDVNKLTDVEAVKRSVRNLVLTNHYERPFHPELGCGIRGLLFENITPIVAIQLERKVEEVINNWEPRALINDISAKPDLDRNAYELVVNFYVVGATEPVTVSTFLERLR
jgi:phage baseplate assembly protein W